MFLSEYFSVRIEIVRLCHFPFLNIGLLFALYLARPQSLPLCITNKLLVFSLCDSERTIIDIWESFTFNNCHSQSSRQTDLHTPIHNANAVVQRFLLERMNMMIFLVSKTHDELFILILQIGTQIASTVVLFRSIIFFFFRCFFANVCNAISDYNNI